MPARWIVERTQNVRFPFRIRIEQDGRPLLAVRAQHAWPGAGSQIFCLRETEFDPAEPLEPLESVPVANLARIGGKLAVTLDRPQRKRCEFLKFQKPYRDQPGTYEQIFFRTEAGARAHRSSNRVELFPHGALDLVVDVHERYPWRFPGARVVVRRLPVGDYALLDGERIVAVVERKAIENFLVDIHEIRGLHQQLAELGAYPHAALVIEAPYRDLANPARTGRWPPSHVLRVVAELTALHPTVPVVFAGNRKLANAWTQRFFAAVAAAIRQPVPEFVREPVVRFEADPADGGEDTRIRVAALTGLADGFTIVALRAAGPGGGAGRRRRGRGPRRAGGRRGGGGGGRAARWVRVVQPAG